MSRIIEAARFAAAAHCDQKRKYNGTPFIMHPMRVAGRVTIHESTLDEMVCAAWCHDVLEDCPDITETRLEACIGEVATRIVRELTNPSEQHKHLRRAERKLMDAQHIAKCSRAARIIKLIDRIDNLREMQGCEDKFLILYTSESRQLLEHLRGTDGDLELELERLCHFSSVG